MKRPSIFALAVVLAAIVVVPAQGAFTAEETVIEVRPGAPTFLPATAACPGGRLVLPLTDTSGRRGGHLRSCVKRLEFDCHETDPSGCVKFDRRVFTRMSFALPGGLIVIDARIDETGAPDVATGDILLGQSYSGDVTGATGTFTGMDGTLSGGGVYTFHPDGSATADAVMVITLATHL